MPQQHPPFDIEDVLDKATLEEKCSLLSGSFDDRQFFLCDMFV